MLRWRGLCCCMRRVDRGVFDIAVMVHQRRNAGVSPLRRQSAPPPVEMTTILPRLKDDDFIEFEGLK